MAEIDPTWRVLEAVEKVHSAVEIGKGKTLTAGQLLERFGFAGEKQWTRVGDLSGGERRRLQLLRLLMDGPNVLLLDEPTNDLDIDTLTAFEDILDGWPGTLLVVSHDRYFLERTTDQVAALYGDGRIRLLPGGVDEYLAHREQRPLKGFQLPGNQSARPAVKPVGRRCGLSRGPRREERAGAHRTTAGQDHGARGEAARGTLTDWGRLSRSGRCGR